MATKTSRLQKQQPALRDPGEDDPLSLSQNSFHLEPERCEALISNHSSTSVLRTPFRMLFEPNPICGRGWMGTRMPRPLQASCIPASRGIRVDFRLQPLPVGFLGNPKPATLLTCLVCLPVDWKHVRLTALTWVTLYHGPYDPGDGSSSVVVNVSNDVRG